MPPLRARALVSRANRAGNRRRLSWDRRGFYRSLPLGTLPDFLDEIEVREDPKIAVRVRAVAGHAEDVERIQSRRTQRKQDAPVFLTAARRLESEDMHGDASASLLDVEP